MRITAAESILLLGLTVALVGCGATIVPPAHPADPVPVFVTDYGRHSSLVLPDGRGHLVEYAWGDWDWFALDRTSLWNGVVALFCSRGAGLGTRQVDTSPDDPHLARLLQCEHLLRFDADRTRVVGLLQSLHSRFERHLDTEVYSPSASLTFVRDDEHYAAWHNCNHVTAEWLRSLGCRIEGSPLTSKFKLASPAATQPAPAAPPPAPAPAG